MSECEYDVIHCEVCDGTYDAPHQPPKPTQEQLDGLALRLLREALPVACYAEVFIAPKGFQVRVFRLPWGEDEETDVVVKGGYPTIAAAADAARAALGGP